MNAPRIAFCTTCKGRTQHLKQTLPQNLKDNADYANCVFVLLDYGSPDDLLEYVHHEFEPEILSGRLVVYSISCEGSFRMAHAKNVAHRLGQVHSADVLVNLDADNYTGPGFATWIAQNLKPGQFLWARMIQQCRDASWLDPAIACVLERGHEGPHRADLHPDEEQRPRVRGISGRLVVYAMDFLKVGGYDERFNDWGPDDKDFNLRLQALGLAPVEIPARFLGCIHHGPKLRYREYRHVAKTADCYDAPLPPPQTCIANYGKFGCGKVRYPEGCYFIELTPVPTRVFGIGMHKTGTTSLFEALNILGFDCAHWNTPRWARTVWRQMTRWGFSPTFEKHYSATDFPITTLYKELDRAYPGSKFILTVRDELDWLRSVADHFSYEKNPYRKDWDWDCFSHHLHEEVYGQRQFDALVFLSRYRRHNAEVIEYFKDRPGDLLVMKEPRWADLCAFLSVSVPSTPYPRANGTQGVKA